MQISEWYRFFNYLGALIDSYLTFEPECSKVKSMAMLRLYQLRKLKKFMDKDLSLLVYKQILLPDIVVDSGQSGTSRPYRTTTRGVVFLLEIHAVYLELIPTDCVIYSQYCTWARDLSSTTQEGPL